MSWWRGAVPCHKHCRQYILAPNKVVLHRKQCRTNNEWVGEEAQFLVTNIVDNISLRLTKLFYIACNRDNTEHVSLDNTEHVILDNTELVSLDNTEHGA